MIITEISKSYKSADGSRCIVLDKFSLNVSDGDFISVMGPSGSGKTTLLKILCGLERADSGQIIFEDKNLCEFGKDDFAELRRDNIGIVFQDFCLIDNLSVKENILLPRLLLDNVAEEDAEKDLNKLIDFLGIGDILEEEIVHLSGGEKQRVAICRALVNSPKLILADEPTGNLDARNTIAVMKYLEEINARNNTTIIMVTHDPLAASFSQRAVLVNKGKIFSEVRNTKSRREFFSDLLNQEIIEYEGIFNEVG